MEYSFRSLDPRDLRGEDINFYLTGQSIANDAQKNAQYTTSESMVFNGVRNGVIYRQAIMRKPPNNGVGYIIDLAEIPIPGGVIRVDRCRMAFEHELTLGTYGLPHYNGKSAEVARLGNDLAFGLTASIPGRRTALFCYQGWDAAEPLRHSGNNAEAEESTVLYAYRKRTTQNPAMELMICALLHKTGNDAWTSEELSPIKRITTEEITATHSALAARVTLSDGIRGGAGKEKESEFFVDFADIDGYRSC